MTYDEAIAQLRYEFHKARLQWKIPIDPEVISAILGYDNAKKKYLGEEKLDD